MFLLEYTVKSVKGRGSRTVVTRRLYKCYDDPKQFHTSAGPEPSDKFFMRNPPIRAGIADCQCTLLHCMLTVPPITLAVRARQFILCRLQTLRNNIPSSSCASSSMFIINQLVDRRSRALRNRVLSKYSTCCSRRTNPCQRLSAKKAFFNRHVEANGGIKVNVPN